MKQLFYNVSLFLISICAFSQTKTLFKKSFEASSIDIIELNVKNIPLDINESNDSKVHINFELKFKNYKEEEIDSITALFQFSSRKLEKRIVCDFSSEKEVSKLKYDLNSPKSKEISNHFEKNIKQWLTFRKSIKTKAEILENYDKNLMKEYFYELKKKAKESEKGKILELSFLVSIPNKLKSNLRFKALQSRMNFSNLYLKNLDGFVDDSYLKIRSIEGSNLLCHNGSVLLGEVESSIVKVRSVSGVTIGGISNSNLITENTDVQIGEIEARVDVKDYNSKIFLYNFSNDFKTFDFKGEYSTVNFYKPKNDFTLKVYGHSTIFKYGEIEQKHEIKNKNKLMFKMKRKLTKDFAGNINFNLVNSKFNLPDFVIRKK